MRTLIFGVDTAEDLRYSCFVSGSKTAFIQAYKDMDEVLVSYNQKGVFHWKSLTSNMRKKVSNKLFQICNKSNLWFTIFEHKRPRGADWKKFYLREVTNSISKILEKQLQNKAFDIVLLFDDDFHIKNIKDGTLRFMEALIRNLAFRLSGSVVNVRGKKELIAEFKYDDNLIRVKAYKVSRKNSIEVQVSDFVLGLYRFLPTKKTSKIFRKY